MDKNQICEAMYALPEGVIVRRRKPLMLPAVLVLAGVGLIVVNNYFSAVLSDDLRSALVFIGGVAVVVGAIMVLARLMSSSGAPYHTPSKRRLRYEELCFDRKVWHEVAECIAQGDVARLRQMKTSQVPELSVALYATPDDRFAAAQAFEYTDLEYRPLTELRIMNQ